MTAPDMSKRALRDYFDNGWRYEIGGAFGIRYIRKSIADEAIKELLAQLTTATDECPTCHGAGCPDCQDEDAGAER